MGEGVNLGGGSLQYIVNFSKLIWGVLGHGPQENFEV